MDKDRVEKVDQGLPASAAMEARVAQEGGGVSVEEKAPQTTKVHIATFRGIPPKLHQSIKNIAKELGISPGELARYFLEHGLKRIEAGEDEVAPTFVPGGYTLYPDEKKATAGRPRRKRSKSGQQPRSYYGVPRELVRAVLDQSQALGITQGELARHFFERGIELYKSGELILEPVPVQQIATLYPKDLG